MTTESLHDTITEQGRFEARLEQFISNVGFDYQVPFEVRQEVRTEVIRCVFGIQGYVGYQKVRSLGQKNGFREDFKFFKSEYLDSSYYIHNTLWKSVISFIQNKETPCVDTQNDVEYCLQNLNTEDLKKINEINFDKTIDAESINLEELIMGKHKKKSVANTIRSKTSTLRFISDYDYGLDMEDFQQDLQCEALRVKSIYHKSTGANLDHSDDLDTRFSKYLDTSLDNKVLNIKDFNTYEQRARVSSTHSKLYKERKKLKKKIAKDPTNEEFTSALNEIEDKLKSKNFDYYSTVCSLHRENSKGEGKDFDVQEIYSSAIQPLEDEIDESFDFEELCLNLTSNMSECIKLIVGHYNEEFEKWADGEGYDLDKNTQLVKASLKYCKVSKKDLKGNAVIREFLGVN